MKKTLKIILKIVIWLYLIGFLFFIVKTIFSTLTEEQPKKVWFANANELNLQIETEKVLRKNNLENAFKEVKNGILIKVELGENEFCYQTGFFDTKENNWLELEKQEGNKYKYFFNYFRNLNYKITSLEKGGNGFCFSW